MTEVEQFVVEYIGKKENLPDNVDIHNLDYIETGYIDSIGFITFVVELEDYFGIEFSEEELKSQDFRIVGKLSDLIEKKKKLK